MRLKQCHKSVKNFSYVFIIKIEINHVQKVYLKKISAVLERQKGIWLNLELLMTNIPPPVFIHVHQIHFWTTLVYKLQAQLDWHAPRAIVTIMSKTHARLHNHTRTRTICDRDSTLYQNHLFFLAHISGTLSHNTISIQFDSCGLGALSTSSQQHTAVDYFGLAVIFTNWTIYIPRTAIKRVHRSVG